MTSSSSSSSRSWKYDVFLSFRGEDTRKTFVDHLYKALEDRLVRTYKDDITLPRGESVGPALLEAIEESHIAVIVFSKNYADSSWCLDELVHIMKCRDEMGLTVIPVFYDVDPSEVRYQKRKFGEAFSKQEMKNVTKAEFWRKALVDASNISGWEPKNVASGHEAAVIQNIVDAISDKLLSSNSDIDEELVGMRARVEQLISRLEVGTGGVRMVGIWGVGGGGKTTLATSVYMKIKDRFRGHCIVDNIREESSKHGRTTLQGKILSTLLKTQVVVQSEEEGKCLIKSRLCHSNVLILLDDVDDCKQLEALAGSHKWFGDGSRIIITTRDEHVLRTRKVDHICPVTLLSQNEGIRLFKKHAYNEEEPLKDYGILSLRVVSYADGLPLALKVLGSFLYDKDEKEWMSTLDRLKEIPESEIVEKLKISYDGLKTAEKELFLDIVCFFRGEYKDDAMEIFEACGFHPHIGIKVLIQKALITIDSQGSFDMHDLVQEMGHYIVREEHPNNPEKHSRLWKYEEIRNVCPGDTTMENDKTEGIYPYNTDDHQPLIYLKMDPNIKKLRWLIVKESSSEAPDFLSNDLQYIDWYGYPASSFPDSFQPTNLAVLNMFRSLQKELWKGWKHHLPHLKVLRLRWMKELVSTPDFDGLPSLQILELDRCDKLEEIHPSLGNHKSLKYIRVRCPDLKKFPRIDHMKKLENLHITSLHWNLEIPEIQSVMENLVKLFLSGSYRMQVFLSSVAIHCPNLISLAVNEYNGSNHLSKSNFNLSQLTVLVHLDLTGCIWLEKLPEFPPSIVILRANGCKRLTDVGDSIRNCKWLCQVSVIYGGILNDGDRLLQSMLQGKAIENHSMVLLLEGLQIPREFRPRLQAGYKCTLQLPENWCNDFCGFLMCAVVQVGLLVENPMITMKQVRGGSMGIDSQDDVDSEDSQDDVDLEDSQDDVDLEDFRDDKKNMGGAVSFFISTHRRCGGFGVSLVPRTSGSGPTDTSPPEYYHDRKRKKYDFKPEFEIEDDLTCTFRIPSTEYISRDG
ncbi:toll/interleukin-1 receptor (TIR) domain-containing protein [Artemisia annua]|uniref:ADP-ribosyl cyclase/cyclic ADP-ribose hydrolase n=1 Tax=Artemisia annua TaxID=35608 RepID=A0A2U1M9S8_ARTAN|nr:toll/interleukin-1 receptor (TIR) domain-containing protein [Artemisia annua]